MDYRIIKITPDGNVSTFFGSTYGYADGKGSDAKFRMSCGLAVDSVGIVYVADTRN